MRAVAIGALLALAASAGALYGWKSRQPAANADTNAVASAGACTIAPSPDAAHPGMVWVEGGTFTMGADGTFPEEGPARQAQVAGFWMDQTEVTNAQFAGFVAATGYVTRAEREGGSALFHVPDAATATQALVDWWKFERGADWRHPQGPGSDIAQLAQHPVVHVAYEDALAYARWKGRSLPTEEQFEFASQGTNRRAVDGSYGSNTWQGSFPADNTAADGYTGTAPVGCFTANRHGLHDMIGNVWEWTTTPYYARHGITDAARPGGFDPMQPDERDVAVLKGGSYLCAPDYCMRYRPEARIGHVHTLSTSHIGFRTVLNP
jgi:formylglycine-generating enzyme required for sulfatase activity